MNRINNGYYNTTNNFGDFTGLINEFLQTLYYKSLKLYEEKYARSNKHNTRIFEIEKIEESLEYIDDYLYYYHRFNNESFISILENLINKLKYVTVFPPIKRGLYGEYKSSEKTLYINPQLRANSRLTSNERTRLYICHELGHIQNEKWMEKTVPILNKVRMNNEDRQLIYDGFSLLDEATTQDRAENITYYFSHKNRPTMTKSTTQLFNGKPFETNFDYYGEFQTPTISFAKTLSEIGKLDNNESVMKEFNKRSLSEDFSNQIFNEYAKNGKIDKLYYILKRLGIIKNASYAAFGYSDKEYLEKSSEALQEYYQLVNKMQNYSDSITRT